MINILIPVNKNVSPEYKYYSIFLMRLSDYMAELNMKVTFLLTSKKLTNQFKSKIVILGEDSLDNNKSIILRINDRGPYVDGRVLDCSYGAAKKLDFVEQGITDVRVEVIKWGDNVYKKQN